MLTEIPPISYQLVTNQVKIYIILQLLSVTYRVDCARENLRKFSDQIIVGRPLEDETESGANRIITINDYGALSIRNLASAYNLSSENQREEGTSRLSYPPLGDDSIGSSPESFQEANKERGGEKDERRTTFHKEPRRDATIDEPVDEPLIEELQCDNSTMRATIVLPKTFVVEPEFNDLLDDPQARGHCTLSTIKSRLYPTYSLTVTDFELCGVTRQIVGARESTPRDQKRRRGWSRGRRRRRRHNNHYEEGEDYEDGQRLGNGVEFDQQAEKNIIYLLNIRFPIIKSLRTNEDTYATLVCAPLRGGESEDYHHENVDEENSGALRKQSSHAPNEPEGQEESRPRHYKVAAEHESAAALPTSKGGGNEFEPVITEFVGNRERGAAAIEATTKAGGSTDAMVASGEHRAADGNQGGRRSERRSNREDDYGAGGRRNKAAIESQRMMNNVTVAAGPAVSLSPSAAAVQIARGKHVTTQTACDDDHEMTRLVRNALVAFSSSSPSPTATTSASTTNATTTTTIPMPTSQLGAKRLTILEAQAAAAAGVGATTMATSAFGAATTGNISRQTGKLHYQARNHVSLDGKNRSLSLVFVSPSSNYSQKATHLQTPQLSERNDDLNLFLLALACSLLMILLIFATLIG